MTITHRRFSRRGKRLLSAFAAAMLLASWGPPANVVREMTRSGERTVTWYFERQYGDFVNGYRVRFIDGKASEVRADEVHAAPRASAASPFPGAVG